MPHQEKDITETERDILSWQLHSLLCSFSELRYLIPQAASRCSLQYCVIWMTVVKPTWERNRGREWRKKVKEKRGSTDREKKRVEKRDEVKGGSCLCSHLLVTSSLLIYIISILCIHLCQHTFRASMFAGTCKQKHKHVTENDTFILTHMQSHACRWGQME